jgi:hypothetical protein
MVESIEDVLNEMGTAEWKSVREPGVKKLLDRCTAKQNAARARDALEVAEELAGLSCGLETLRAFLGKHRVWARSPKEDRMESLVDPGTKLLSFLARQQVKPHHSLVLLILKAKVLQEGEETCQQRLKAAVEAGMWTALSEAAAEGWAAEQWTRGLVLNCLRQRWGSSGSEEREAVAKDFWGTVAGLETAPMDVKELAEDLKLVCAAFTPGKLSAAKAGQVVAALESERMKALRFGESQVGIDLGAELQCVLERGASDTLADNRLGTAEASLADKTLLRLAQQHEETLGRGKATVARQEGMRPREGNGAGEGGRKMGRAGTQSEHSWLRVDAPKPGARMSKRRKAPTAERPTVTGERDRALSAGSELTGSSGSQSVAQTQRGHGERGAAAGAVLGAAAGALGDRT